MIWLLVLVLLTIGGGVAAVNIASKENKRRQLGNGSSSPKTAPKQLTAGGDSLVERTVKDMRVNDVLTIDGKDFLCEGHVEYDEDGHRWAGGRVVDGKDVRWLIVGIERTGSGSTRVMAQDESTPITGYPPEAIVIGEIRFALDKRGAATCKITGEAGVLGGLAKDRAAEHVERCRWWLYSAPGDDTLLVEQWGSDYRVLKGKKVVDGTIELMPGS